ncbi:pyruvate kinase [Lacicoccus qingdaonensis]|uniref:Pyruvate kinase n=1 Tax=Lacicoccus qingdaonensis TaxID=576118 RepID=A0A1G9B926_9BACL|nr:pyruvate kinase [Salinicoccus qingdaonensis]SDK36062.1 pyruvate kinase [Salinicoccus qingdaonensis]
MQNRAMEVLNEILQVRADVSEEGEKLYNSWLQYDIRGPYQDSAQNLANYMAFRQKDMRHLQEELIPWGVSSLGRLEVDVMGTLNAVTKTLSLVAGSELEDESIDYRSMKTFENRYNLLNKHTDEIFGAGSDDRNTHILVTMPTEAANNKEMVSDLIEAGMDMARINCAHDDESVWKKMIENIREASKESGRNCQILIDISGPKIRIKNLLTSKRNPKLQVGEKFLLSNQEAMTLSNGIEIAINTTVPEVLSNVDKGQLVKLDDGHIEAEVVEIRDAGLVCETVKTVKENGVKVKTEKGINFPDLDIRLSVLTEKDYVDLKFAAANADVIAFSFIKSDEDIATIEAALEKELTEEKAELPVVAKIETAEAIDNIPSIIASGSARRPFGVMVARGDLAVEIGYERLSEIQEELLWICEAAHVPVIWATQVLESLVKSGIPTRSEISDVVAGSRAECIMLNKGDYIVSGVNAVDDILKKFENHHHKKTSMLRALNIAEQQFQ